MVIARNPSANITGNHIDYKEVFTEYMGKWISIFNKETAVTEKETAVIDYRIALSDGRFECPFCGSRDVHKNDRSCMTCMLPLSGSTEINYNSRRIEVFSESKLEHLFSIVCDSWGMDS